MFQWLKVRRLLRELMADDSDVRDQATRELAQIGGPPVVQPLLRIIGEGDLEKSKKARNALAQIGGPYVVEALLKMLGEGGLHEREEARDALAQIGGPCVVEPLVTLLEASPHRGDLKEVLDGIGVDDVGAFLHRFSTSALTSWYDRSPLERGFFVKRQYHVVRELAIRSRAGDQDATAYIDPLKANARSRLLNTAAFAVHHGYQGQQVSAIVLGLAGDEGDAPILRKARELQERHAGSSEHSSARTKEIVQEAIENALANLQRPAAPEPDGEAEG